MGPLRAFSLLAFSSLILIEAHAATTQASAASASFVYMSDDGCVQNQVIVFANRMTPISSKTPGTAIEVTYFRDRYDYCKESDLGTDTGTSRRPLFSGDLNRAALSATIDGHTVTGSPVTISFDLVWEGKGTITGRKGGSRVHGESGKLMRRQTLSRNAAVNGSVDDLDISGAVVWGEPANDLKDRLALITRKIQIVKLHLYGRSRHLPIHRVALPENTI